MITIKGSNWTLKRSRWGVIYIINKQGGKIMKVTEAILKVKRQKKTDKGTVLMDAMLSSKKKDGGYYAPMWLSLYLGEKTEWVRADYRDQYVKVSGNFTHSDWEKNGKSGKNYTIFVDKLEKYEFKKAEDSDDFMSAPAVEDVPF